MVARRTLNGFSLVEMLVAMVVLSLVIGIATYAYSLFIRNWDGELGRFESAQAHFQRLEWLAAALADTLPYLVEDDDGEIGFYFLGRDEGLTLITMSPLFGIGEPALVRVFREPAADGSWRVVYEEAPFEGQVLSRADQRLVFRHRIVVVSDVPKPEFRYFGWEDLGARLSDDPSRMPGSEWFTEYDGLERRYHPDKIALRLGATTTVFDVPARVDAVLAAEMEGI